MLTLLVLSAFAGGGCPPGLAMSAPANGATVQIVEVAKPDPFAKSADVFVGRTGRASGMVQVGACEFAGEIALDGGGSPYFTRVRLIEQATASACPEGAVTQLSPGQPVRFLSVHADDAYYGTREGIEGKLATADAPDLTEDCWWAGEFTDADGDEYYFYKVAVAAEGEAPAVTEPSCPEGAVRSIAKGTKLTLAALHPDDAYYSSRDGMLGVRGTSVGLHPTEGCWFAGEFTRDDGGDHYFYKAAFIDPEKGEAPAGPEMACPEGAVSGRDLAPGTRLELIALHPDDAFSGGEAEQRLPEVGQVVGNGMSPTESCWYGGEFTSQAGTEYYFFKAAFRAVGELPPPPEPVSAEEVACPAGTLAEVPAGTRVRIAKVHPGDAFFSDRARYEGRLGTATSALTKQESCFFSGEVVLDDGGKPYFFKAAFLPVDK
ncbi:MAG: hypothetical protein EP330_09195 [Deltaproteobacteria bacterium]|nr:MAG: hypothetical protein EP330_09195 [Deltaproteobacteria bacterium]